jgi:FkbM family methyltransferase
MVSYLKNIAKRVLSFFGIHLTQNQRYDALTLKVMKRIIKQDSNCVDIGCHKGEVMDDILRLAPKGHHFAFEPIPELFDALKKKYNGNVSVHQIALSDRPGVTSFHHVLSNPAYSVIRKRSYQQKENIRKIEVPKAKLDDLLPKNTTIDLIKIDVEGAEYEVLKGAVNTIATQKPVIIFEHGLGASDHYGTTPEMLFDFLSEECGLSVSLLDEYVDSGKNLSRKQFCEQFYEGLNYYFVAHPTSGNPISKKKEAAHVAL